MMIWSEAETGRGHVTVNTFNRAMLMDDISRAFTEHSGFSVATLNLDHVVKLKRDSAFRNAYAAHSHVTADGHPIVWLSRLAGQPEVTLVPGSELIEPLAALAAERGVPVALFGATDEALGAAANALRSRYPNLDVALTLSPPMGFDPTGPAADEAIAAIGKSGARLTFLALGAPKQEVFAARAQSALPDVGFLSIGAGLDFIAGTQKRAPRWVRAVAAEWLWRMMNNPGRLVGRYFACLAVLPPLALRAFEERGRRRV